MTTQKSQRRYEPVWELLKTNLEVAVKLTKSDEPTVIARNARTFRKAVQKEKYNDEKFKLRFPDATLISEIDGNSIKFELHLNKPLTLEDLT